ncbi:MAG: hypothetical protein GTO18_06680 [Anaerolineales bacterium]|nr:hypothetical protein [Anaerolineales bacterium]
MTKKTLGYVKLEWTCPHCETRNPGPNKFCNACGAPQPTDVEFHQTPGAELLTDEEEIARAKAGPDVHCPYCNSRNPGDAKFCGECGGDLTGAEAREGGRVVGAYSAEPAPEVICEACGSSNPAGTLVCSHCGARLDSELDDTPEPETKPAAGVKALPRSIIIGAVVVCLVAAAALFFLLFRTEEVTSEVQGVGWTRSVHIEALGPVEHEGWMDEIPSDAEIDSCDSEYRYTQSEPAPNAVEVCGTPYTVDTGSGFGEVVQDCEYEVYDDFCTYTVIEWYSFDVVTVTGSDLNPYWPEFELIEDQREGEREAEYKVIFVSDGDDYVYTTTDFDEFRRYEPGSVWTIEVNTLGGVVSVEEP